MIITTKTAISFKVPEEYQLAYKFKAQHPDWVESATTEFICYKKSNTYAVEMREEQPCDMK